jgi:hypothetical protein
MTMILLRSESLAIRVPVSHPFTLKNVVSVVLTLCYKVWPLPTWQMGEEDTLILSNFLFKLMEVFMFLIYFADLLPKIFFWKRPLWYKIANAFITFAMMAQVPLNLIGY